MTLEDWVGKARPALAAAPFSPSSREAWLLASHVLGLTEAQALARSREMIGPDEISHLNLLLSRRLDAEPVAYLLGRREFFGRDFAVDSRVLIPRPETEHLIEAVLRLNLPQPTRILDLGTGSGCLAITLALELLEVVVVAVDRSLGALAVARANVARHQAEGRVRLLGGDLASALEVGSFDLVVTNPPYVPTVEAALLSPEVRDFEPGEALFAGPDGLGVIDRLLAWAIELRSGSFLVSEIGDGQLPELERRLRALYPQNQVMLADCHRDYAGKPRVVVLKRT